MKEINNIIIQDEILTTKFCCDLSQCKGACCTLESSYGAPLLEEEIPIIEENLEEIYNFLPVKNRKIIEKKGFFEKKQNEIMIKSINNKNCVFAIIEHEIAFCAIERAFNAKKIIYMKPLSCHLFPIRISNFGGDVLRFSTYPECESALKTGSEKNILVSEFCKSALERVYGKAWYKKMINTGGK